MEDTLTIATAEGVRIYAITTKIWCRKLLTAIIQAIWQRRRSAGP